jgi:restriction system protein
MKKANATENSVRGTWTITPTGEDLIPLGQDRIFELVKEGWARFYAERDQGKPKTTKPVSATSALEAELPEPDTSADDWKTELLSVIRNLPPKAFEKLAQVILRESNFESVQVLGKTGDGGLDGVGMLKLTLLTFRVYFQCKRYKEGNNVGPDSIRDFRGALQGRAEKGLFLTTSRFTSEARREAGRDGAVAIDLIDGEQLCDLLKELSLGVKTEMVEEVHLDHQWLQQLA